MVACPTGTRTRTRLRPTEGEAVALTAIGAQLGGLYRGEVAARVRAGRLNPAERAVVRRESKRGLTAVSSSRWAGAITRAVEDQYQLAMRATAMDVAGLRAGIAALAARCAAPVGGRAEGPDGPAGARGYASLAERHSKTRRRAALAARLTAAEAALAASRPKIALGGGRLWHTKNNLAAAGLTEQQWADRWNTARWFFTADGETGKRHGNETIRVTPVPASDLGVEPSRSAGTVAIKVPGALVSAFGTHLTLTVPVSFDTHRGPEWADRIQSHAAVRYDITRDPGTGRWYLDASWGYPPAPPVPLNVLRARRTLGIDLNADHLAGWVIDSSGNPVGPPLTVPLDLTGLPASTRDARLRDAISTLLRHADDTGCASLSIENLNFTDARTTGRETMGRGRRGRTFRRTVAGIPTARFRQRLAGMAATAGIAVIAVDPAYTSRWGAQHWAAPLAQQTPTVPVTRHHAAAVAIGRRAHAHRIRRTAPGPRHGQRTVPGQPTPSLPGLCERPLHVRPAADRPRAASASGPTDPQPLPTPFGEHCAQDSLLLAN